MTMPKRSRLRRILKWTGVGMCVVVLAAWAASTQTSFAYGNTNENAFIGFSLSEGRLVAMYDVFDNADNKIVESFDSSDPWKVRRIRSNSSWRERTGLRLPMLAWKVSFFLAGGGPRHEVTSVMLPLWIPCAAIALPTGFLFRRDRRRIPPGHCQRCGYNLTGNVSGKCSECGEPCKRDADAT